MKKIVRAAVLGVLVLGISACQAIYRNHGYVPAPEALAEIKVGVDTRDSVAEQIGTPGSSGVLNDGGYYYVATRLRYYGARKAQVVSREMVAISFTKSGVVSNIERFGLEDGQIVAFERRVTDTNVQNSSFLRQLMGSLGQFNPGAFGN